MYSDFDRKIATYLVPVCAVGAAIVILSLLARFAVAPLLMRIGEHRHTISSLKDIIESESGSTTVINQISEKRGRLQAKYDAMRSDMGDPADLSGLLQTIFDQAWKTEIKFNKTQPQPEKRMAGYLQYPILFELTASYHALARFIANLEKMPHIVRIDRIALQAAKSGQVDASLQVTCFLRSEGGLVQSDADTATVSSQEKP